MQFGIFGSAQASTQDLGPETGQGFRDYLEFAIEAEALGYHSSFLVEHHFTGWNQVSATLMLLTALAMRTTTLRLGTAVIVLPWHNPVLLAEQAATLDLISGGRLDFGVGKGYRHNEFSGFASHRRRPRRDSKRRSRSCQAPWMSRTRFSHRGRFWQFEDIVVEPPPAQQPHPPFWVAAAQRSRRSAAPPSAASISFSTSTPRPTRSASASRSTAPSARPAAWAFDPMQVTVARQLYVAEGQGRSGSRLRRGGRIHPAHGRRVARCPTARPARTSCPMRRHTRRDRGECPVRTRRTRSASKLEAHSQGGRGICAADDAGGKEQLRRFAREVMPSFAGKPAQQGAGAASETIPV